MSGAVERRARIARVRRVQHLRAAGDAAEAQGRAERLEGTADHLAQLAQALRPQPGVLSGGQLGNLSELVGRLDHLRHGMTDSIVAARATAHEQAARRLEARIAREGAERLEQQAAAAHAIERERRLAVAPRPRTAIV